MSKTSKAGLYGRVVGQNLVLTLLGDKGRKGPVWHEAKLPLKPTPEEVAQVKQDLEAAFELKRRSKD